MINEPVIVGRDIDVEVNGADVSRWDTISGPVMDSNDWKADTASSEREQFVDGKGKQITFTVSGKQGSGTPPANGDTVTGIDIKLGGESLITETLSDPKYGIWKVKNVKYDFKEDAATYSFDIKSDYVR